MKIEILYGNEFTPESDMRQPEKGNPGVGGAQYCLGMLVRYLAKEEDMSLTVYQFRDTHFPENVEVKKITSWEEALRNEGGVDALICTHRSLVDDYDKMKSARVPIVLWVHNHLSVEQADAIVRCDAIKRVVFVGRQLYDLYLDHRICKKSTYIFNMFKGDLEEYRRQDDYEKIVTYMGNLDPSKGFHILAEQWKGIVSEAPDAQLYVIGSGKLYTREARLGKFGLAEEQYEKRFMPHLLNDKGELLDSVHFCGVLGQEKYNIFNKTAVGIINPSALTETFGLSAVEMEACGIPMVTKAAQGLLDTSIHGQTGLLYNREKDLKKFVVRLLSDRELNKKLGAQAKEFVSAAFAPETLIKEWIQLLHEVGEGREAQYRPPVNFFLKQNKWLRLVNRQVHKVTGSQMSLMEWKAKVLSHKE